ncbi:hypothetical protein DFH06DRAFT_1133841 [Mycena polygramma]|nr:hypothetical protein DFH06DRAFT_1133841 [Mycena polygramma]
MPPNGLARCVPPYQPEPGHEDVVAFLAQGGVLYVVSKGTICGIFTSEQCARKQVEGYPNGRWRKAKKWEHAIDIWNEGCDAYHEIKCPSHIDTSSPATDRLRTPAPTGRQDVDHHNAKVVFDTGDDSKRYRATKVTEAESYAMRSSASQALSTSICVRPSGLYVEPSVRASPTKVSVSAASLRSPAKASARLTSSIHASTSVQASSSPSRRRLSEMDAVEAFSRMGVADPCPSAPPAKQWVIGGVNKFFADRLGAINHIFALDIQQAHVMGSRNVHKLRVFQRGERYVPLEGDVQYDDDE